MITAPSGYISRSLSSILYDYRTESSNIAAFRKAIKDVSQNLPGHKGYLGTVMITVMGPADYATILLAPYGQNYCSGMIFSYNEGTIKFIFAYPDTFEWNQVITDKNWNNTFDHSIPYWSSGSWLSSDKSTFVLRSTNGSDQSMLLFNNEYLLFEYKHDNVIQFDKVLKWNGLSYIFKSESSFTPGGTITVNTPNWPSFVTVIYKVSGSDAYVMLSDYSKIRIYSTTTIITVPSDASTSNSILITIGYPTNGWS